jgi:hypothetical protein
MHTSGDPSWPGQGTVAAEAMQPGWPAQPGKKFFPKKFGGVGKIIISVKKIFLTFIFFKYT